MDDIIREKIEQLLMLHDILSKTEESFSWLVLAEMALEIMQEIEQLPVELVQKHAADFGLKLVDIT